MNTTGQISTHIVRFERDDFRETSDSLVVEEPLEIRLGHGPLSAREKRNLSITMRTPGHDDELAVGFLFTEGILTQREQVLEVSRCGNSGNVIRVDLVPEVGIDLKKIERHFYTTSSCGVCGKSSLEALKTNIPQFESFARPFPREILHALPHRLSKAQGIFQSTGGVHASALFDFDGKILSVREDVGRHNALDKLIGHSLMQDKIPLTDGLLLVSGRASFELVQKAAMAGVRRFAAIGAPSSLAVDLAKEARMTLIGFLRNDRFNIYSGGPEEVI